MNSVINSTLRAKFIHSRKKYTLLAMSNVYERNKGPILDVLKQIIPSESDTSINVLEIASGGGHHVAYFAEHFNNVKWQPTDSDQSYVSYMKKRLNNILKNNLKVSTPLTVDTRKEPQSCWFDGKYQQCFFDFILCINMTHVSEWQATEGLFSGSNYYLKQEGSLVIYGPFIVYGDYVHENNISFDKQLKSQNPKWGLRDVSQLNKLAETNCMKLIKIFDMPANNKTLIYGKH